MPHPQLLKKFGERVRDCRKSKGWSQQELADKAGLHKNYIGMVERGERNPSLINVDLIAKSLGITPSKLLES